MAFCASRLFVCREKPVFFLHLDSQLSWEALSSSNILPLNVVNPDSLREICTLDSYYLVRSVNIPLDAPSIYFVLSSFRLISLLCFTSKWSFRHTLTCTMCSFLIDVRREKKVSHRLKCFNFAPQMTLLACILITSHWRSLIEEVSPVLFFKFSSQQGYRKFQGKGCSKRESMVPEDRLLQN